VRTHPVRFERLGAGGSPHVLRLVSGTQQRCTHYPRRQCILKRPTSRQTQGALRTMPQRCEQA
jgi:hypothetical protein